MANKLNKSVKKSVKVGEWCAAHTLYPHADDRYELNRKRVDALPGGFNPFSDAVRELVGTEQGDYPFIFREVRGEVFRTPDGSYRYDILYVQGEQTCDWEFNAGEASLDASDSDQSGTFAEAITPVQFNELAPLSGKTSREQ